MPSRMGALKRIVYHSARPARWRRRCRASPCALGRQACRSRSARSGRSACSRGQRPPSDSPEGICQQSPGSRACLVFSTCPSASVLPGAGRYSVMRLASPGALRARGFDHRAHLHVAFVAGVFVDRVVVVAGPVERTVHGAVNTSGPNMSSRRRSRRARSWSAARPPGPRPIGSVVNWRPVQRRARRGAADVARRAVAGHDVGRLDHQRVAFPVADGSCPCQARRPGQCCGARRAPSASPGRRASRAASRRSRATGRCARRCCSGTAASRPESRG